MDGKSEVIFEANWHEGVIELTEAQCLEKFGWSFEEGLQRSGKGSYYGRSLFRTREEAVKALIEAEETDIENLETSIEENERQIERLKNELEQTRACHQKMLKLRTSEH